MNETNPPSSLLATRRRLFRRLGGLALLAALAGGGALTATGVGQDLLAAMRYEFAAAPPIPLDLTIAPPSYSGASPLTLARRNSAPAVGETALPFEVPQGSVVQARIDANALNDANGNEPPVALRLGLTKALFARDAQGDWVATLTVTSGERLRVTRGWRDIASWSLHVLPDAPPAVAWQERPSLVEAKALRLPYRANDTLGLAEIALRVTPHNPLPGANVAPIEIPLPAPQAKRVERVDVEDIVSQSWIGQPVTLQIVATNLAGQRSLSEPIDLVMPTRAFVHPVARLLIEARSKLMVRPDDARLRAETANVMALMAQDPARTQNDPVLMMALRAGAVRLILGNDRAASVAVGDILWNAAARIEDGQPPHAKRALRDNAQRSLARALPGHIESENAAGQCSIYMFRPAIHRLGRRMNAST